MVTEIEAKTILNTYKQPDLIFGLKYGMNLYRGCQHQCIYCDSRSECYQLGNLAKIRVKINAIKLLADALPRKRVRGTIGTGSMNDPYMPIEQNYNLTGQALEVIAHNHFPVHVITKSDLVLKDLETLKEISQTYAAVSFTITTTDDGLGKKLEPGAPLVSRRFAAMRKLAESGILTGVTMMPILPFIEDTEENVLKIVELAHANGASYIIPWFGMSLRTGSREYFYQKLDLLFPGMKQKYIAAFGERYMCNAPNGHRLEAVFTEACLRCGIRPKMPIFTPEPVKGNRQPRLF